MGSHIRYFSEICIKDPLFKLLSCIKEKSYFYENHLIPLVSGHNQKFRLNLSITFWYYGYHRAKKIWTYYFIRFCSFSAQLSRALHETWSCWVKSAKYYIKSLLTLKSMFITVWNFHSIQKSLCWFHFYNPWNMRFQFLAHP